MKPYFEDLKAKFYEALEEIKKAEDKKVFMVGCKEAGNYDYLFILGSIMDDTFTIIHIDYTNMNTVTTDFANKWFLKADEGFYDQYEDLFEAEWSSMEELQLHLKLFTEGI